MRFLGQRSALWSLIIALWVVQHLVGCAAPPKVIEDDVNFDGRIAAGVEDLAGDDFVDHSLSVVVHA